VMGDEALDVVTASWYSATLDTPANRGFVDGIRVNFGHDPGFYAVGTYTAGLFLETALTALQGDTSDPEKLRKTLAASKLAYGPIGAIRLDNFGTPVLDVHIRKVERRSGKLVNTVINTYHDVSQFWTYDPQKFLADPAYSRAFPAGKYLE
jgi:branched-chain amino acid transport system substrate-binding protein